MNGYMVPPHQQQPTQSVPLLKDTSNQQVCFLSVWLVVFILVSHVKGMSLLYQLLDDSYLVL